MCIKDMKTRGGLDKKKYSHTCTTAADHTRTCESGRDSNEFAGKGKDVEHIGTAGDEARIATAYTVGSSVTSLSHTTYTHLWSLTLWW